jgi:hypothetical protein
MAADTFQLIAGVYIDQLRKSRGNGGSSEHGALIGT